jgi:hypothetical protein
MPTFNTTDPKPGFVYDQDTDTWYPLLGIATQSLDGLTDVIITSPATNQSLIYDGTNWINSTEIGDITAVTSGTGITVTNGTGPIPSIAINTAVTVDLSTVQTLTNKTLTSPAINTATLNTPVVVSPEERTTVSATAPTSTTNFDTDTQAVLFLTSSTTSDWTLNVRGSGSTTFNSKLAIGDSMSIIFIATNGGTAYRHTALTIDGNAQTVLFSGGTAPAAGNASSRDAYSFTIFKTANATFTVFGAGPVKYA